MGPEQSGSWPSGCYFNRRGAFLSTKSRQTEGLKGLDTQHSKIFCGDRISCIQSTIRQTKTEHAIRRSIHQALLTERWISHFITDTEFAKWRLQDGNRQKSKESCPLESPGKSSGSKPLPAGERRLNAWARTSQHTQWMMEWSPFCRLVKVLLITEECL